jgi:hypothetical protein
MDFLVIIVFFSLLNSNRLTEDGFRSNIGHTSYHNLQVLPAPAESIFKNGKDNRS